MRAVKGRMVESGAPVTVIEWGWAYQRRIRPMESEEAARAKVKDNGGRVVNRIRVQPPALISAWIDPLTTLPEPDDTTLPVSP